jgi:hypothetical protein
MRKLRCITWLAASCLVLSAGEKQLRPGESEMYNEVLRDLGGTNPAKAVADLEAWRQKFPESDYGDERSALYVQAYALSNQPAKALNAAEPLLAKDPGAAFTGAEGQPVIIRLLYNAVWAISQATDPTPSEISTGTRAAQQLMAYDRALPGVTAEKWNEARADMRDKAAAALLHIAILPGIQAMAKRPPDCASAEQAYSRALSDYPTKAAISYELGKALICEARTDPGKQSLAIYEFLRAATIDPTLGDPRNDQKKIQAFADNAYIRFHGSDEGLDQLRQKVKEGALPPADFKIATAADVANATQERFEQDHPQLALWMRIKATLAATDGEQYFASEMKDAAVPQLQGTLLEARPACRARELLVAVPLPDAATPARAEITLKLDKALPGKADLHTELRWEGVATAFVRDPFLLTMEVKASAIQGLKITSCTRP